MTAGSVVNCGATVVAIQGMGQSADVGEGVRLQPENPEIRDDKKMIYLMKKLFTFFRVFSQ